MSLNTSVSECECLNMSISLIVNLGDIVNVSECD